MIEIVVGTMALLGLVMLGLASFMLFMSVRAYRDSVMVYLTLSQQLQTTNEQQDAINTSVNQFYTEATRQVSEAQKHTHQVRDFLITEIGKLQTNLNEVNAKIEPTYKMLN